MYQIVLFIHVLLSIALVVLVLMQNGKGAEIGAAFGSGASQTVFGSQGASGFLLKFTGAIAIGFFATSLFLGAVATREYKRAKELDLPVQATRVLSEKPLKKEVITDDEIRSP